MTPGKKRGRAILPIRSLYGGILENGGLRGVLHPGRVQKAAILQGRIPQDEERRNSTLQNGVPQDEEPRSVSHRNGIRRQGPECRKEALTGAWEPPPHKGIHASLHGHLCVHGPSPSPLTPPPEITNPRNLPLPGRAADFSASGKGENSLALPRCGDDTLQKHLLTLG